jgi:hypothetical protein
MIPPKMEFFELPDQNQKKVSNCFKEEQPIQKWTTRNTERVLNEIRKVGAWLKW